MTYLNNKGDLKSQRRFLRNNATSHEIKLWNKLRNSQLGYKFRRQHSIGYYIVDFCCPRQKVIIEIDGNSHNNTESQGYDHVRTLYLQKLGFRELRFKNEEIDRNINDVIERIVKFITTP
jgi:very-short-patch-repair endonuclease